MLQVDRKLFRMVRKYIGFFTIKFESDELSNPIIKIKIALLDRIIAHNKLFLNALPRATEEVLWRAPGGRTPLATSWWGSRPGASAADRTECQVRYVFVNLALAKTFVFPTMHQLIGA